MGQAKDKEKHFERYVQDLKKNYQYIFGTDEGKQVMSDLEKRCHHHTTTNVKGDRKAMLQNENEKGK